MLVPVTAEAPSIRQRLSPYGVELLLILVSVVVGLIQAHWASNGALALAVVTIGFLIAGASLAIRNELDARLGQLGTRIERVSVIGDLISRIPREDWREDALGEVDLLINELTSWNSGFRSISRNDSVPYQANAIRGTAHSLDAIQIATKSDALRRWTPGYHGGFVDLVEANRSLLPTIKKRRIILLDKTEDGLIVPGSESSPVIQSELVRGVCGRMERPAEVGGFGVELRVLWLQDVLEADMDPPADLLITDGQEAIIVTQVTRPGDREPFRTEVVRNLATLSRHIRAFERFWRMSEPSGRFLPEQDSVAGDGQ
jgi:hypothetical protein